MFPAHSGFAETLRFSPDGVSTGDDASAGVPAAPSMGPVTAEHGIQASPHDRSFEEPDFGFAMETMGSRMRGFNNDFC